MMKRHIFSLKQKIVLAVNLLFVAAFCLLLFHWGNLVGQLESQHAAERWQGGSEQNFAQASCFLPNTSGFSEDSIYSFREKLEEDLVAMGLNLEEGTVLYTDAWSGAGELTANGSYGSAILSVITIGGNWFDFHPMELRSGSYIRGSELMHDRVVFSEEAAFQLFGAIDVAGLEITINNKPYLVAGVVALEDDKFTEKVRLAEHPYMFAYCDAFSDIDITCYELIAAEPLRGSVANAVDELASDYDDSITVDNSRRFSVSSIDELIWRFGLRSVVQNGTAFPYWENAARVIEDHLALTLIALVITSIIPVSTAVYYVSKGIGRCKESFRKKREGESCL